MNTEPAIDIRDLRKSFPLHVRLAKKRVALDGLSLSVQAGEVFGFLGPNGAGKTTTIKVLTSLLHQDSGEALVFGKSPSEPSARKRLGFLPESPVFYEHLTARELLQLCGALVGLSGAGLRQHVDKLLGEVGLANAADLQLRRYSKGMTQRVGIAQALLGDPDLIVLDEPMSGLDPMGRGDVRDIILALRKRGKTIFFSTHIIPDVEVICDRVGIISKGKLVRVGGVRELLSEGATGACEVVAEGLPAGFSFDGCSEATQTGGRSLFVVANPQIADKLLGEVLRVGGHVISMTPRQASLEDLVVKMLASVESR